MPRKEKTRSIEIIAGSGLVVFRTRRGSSLHTSQSLYTSCKHNGRMPTSSGSPFPLGSFHTTHSTNIAQCFFHSLHIAYVMTRGHVKGAKLPRQSMWSVFPSTQDEQNMPVDKDLFLPQSAHHPSSRHLEHTSNSSTFTPSHLEQVDMSSKAVYGIRRK